MTNYGSTSIIYIVGPTASGKTALSIKIAKLLDAEIICADSQTIRRGMNIGTAKPTTEEMQCIPHHMLDIIDPYDYYSLAEYQKTARAIMADIASRGKKIIVVGGTGLYIDALYFNFKLPELGKKHSVRRSELAVQSVEALQNSVRSNGLVMPTNSLNKRHLINTLLRGGSPGTTGMPDGRSQIVGISPDRELLIERINTRVDDMFDRGFVDEVRSIISQYGEPPREFDAIGYRIIMRMLASEISEAEARELVKIANRQYAKKQMSWFRRSTEIQWFKGAEQALDYIMGHSGQEC
jgi:tRNA dimethylallyltransferase